VSLSRIMAVVTFVRVRSSSLSAVAAMERLASASAVSL
jgi:hypothetical protein